MLRLPYLPHTRCLRHRFAFALTLLLAVGARAQQPASKGVSLDSLLNTRISTASKYSQRSAEAPASVTVLAADEIRQFGFRNLGEALESVRGMYFSSDRNYVYLGTRGFGRPTDYNNRILLLIDGHTMNEQEWGAAMVGSDLPIALDAVERIEIVRGPGSAMYGTSAMFAVINIVTKTGIEIDGATVSTQFGSAGARQASLVAGRSLGARNSFAVSGLVMRSDGKSQYYPAFDSPETNLGVARNLDWEEGASGIASLVMGDITGHVGYRTRSKGIPTGAYGLIFNDPRAKTVDQTLWGDIAAHWILGARFRVQSRLYADRYSYDGVYPFEPGTSTYIDGGGDADAGAEAMLIWDQASRHRLTIGSEFRTVWRAEYFEQQADGSRTQDNAPFDISSIFAQDELQLTPELTLVSGLRWAQRTQASAAFVPRLGLVLAPDALTSVKLLYGEAYRDPTTSEAFLTTTFYARNPNLKSERIRTVELEFQRRLADPVLLGASLFDYHVTNLIDQVSSGAGVRFENVASSHGRGVELQMDVLPVSPLSARAQFSGQDAHDESTGVQLTNSPRYISSLSLLARDVGGYHSALTIRHESGRRTIVDTKTNAFTRADLTVGYLAEQRADTAWWRGLEVSIRATNLFDTAYSVPAGFEHVQSTIPQDGRMLSLRLGWSF